MKVQNPWEAWTQEEFSHSQALLHRTPGNHEKEWDSKDQKLQNSLSQSTGLGEANRSHHWKGMKLKNGQDSSTLSSLDNKNHHVLREKAANPDDLSAQIQPHCSWREGKEKPSTLVEITIYDKPRLS